MSPEAMAACFWPLVGLLVAVGFAAFGLWCKCDSLRMERDELRGMERDTYGSYAKARDARDDLRFRIAAAKRALDGDQPPRA